jgi:homoserine dehydrogenase
MSRRPEGGQRKSIGIGLMGLGVVGSGVARALIEKKSVLAAEVGCPLTLRRVLVRDPGKARPVALEGDILTTDPKEILSDPEIDIVVELMGGEHPALEYVSELLQRHCYVVTANKEMMAKHGEELLATARDSGVAIMFEASVGGGIPLLMPLQQGLLANEISTIYAIINGTTNYILTRMSSEGTGFAEALKKAQELGYAEPNAANDIDGTDATYKLAILASMAFHAAVRPEDVYSQGIDRLTEADFRYAKELGYEIKLLAIGKQVDGAIEVRVHPAFIPTDFLLAKVSGVYNAVQIEGDLVGKLIFYGRGAGSLPTSSAVLGDVIALGQVINAGKKGLVPSGLLTRKPIKAIAELQTNYYLRMRVADQPGVLAQVARILGDRDISIASVIQKVADERTQTAEIVIMTHPAKEQYMQQALSEIEMLPVIKEVCNLIRVEG